MPVTTESVMFVSHFDVKRGHQHSFHAMWDATVGRYLRTTFR